MRRTTTNHRNLPPISDEEMCREVQQAFSQPQMPGRASLAIQFKVMAPPASSSNIELLLTSCGGALPLSYLNFLKHSDGAAQCISDYDGDYLTLWASEKVVSKIAALPQSQVATGLLVVGCDGRGGWLGFDRAANGDPECWPVVRLHPDGGDLQVIALNFQAWENGDFRLRPGGFLCGGG
jgi:hypothetical protein